MREGAELAFTYPNESIEKRVRPLAESLGVRLVLPCDVTQRRGDRGDLFASLRERWGDARCRSSTPLPSRVRDELKGRFVDTVAPGFQIALDVSAYSLVAIARHAEPLMARAAASLLTLTYFGAEKVMPHYNVMGVAKAALEACVRYLAADLGPQGIRVNAISAGPLRTLSVRGNHRLQDHAAPSRRARAAAAQHRRRRSRRGRALSLQRHGQRRHRRGLHVDAGYNIMGM